VAERWYITLPQRQATFRKQLTGGFEYDGAWIENAQKEFNDRQVMKYDAFFGYYEKRKKIPSVNFHLPRTVGGLGLCPLSTYRFSAYDAALYLQLTKHKTKRDDYVKFITPRLVTPSAMKVLGNEVSHVRNILGCSDLEIERDGDDWDEQLERYGISDEDCTARLIRGYVNNPLWLTEDDLGEGFEMLGKISQRPGYKSYSNTIKDVNRLITKWKRTPACINGIPAAYDLNAQDLRAQLYNKVGFKIVRELPILPRL